MLSRAAKAMFYRVAGPLMAINGFLHRHFRTPASGILKVHLGPGQKNYIDGWINIDANMFTAKCDMWLDLRNRLPFGDGTVDCFYSHHVIEHLPDVQFHLKDVHRCLKPGGIYRVGGPNGDSAIKKFCENDKEWFSNFPDRRNSIGGRFENFIFCRGEHVTILTCSFLEEILADSGFAKTTACSPVRETTRPDLFDACLKKENESDFQTPHTLILEAVKSL